MNLSQTLWKNRKYHLDRMSLGDLTIAYFQYPAIQTYIVFLVVSTYYALTHSGPIIPLILAASLSVVIYPLAWHLLHQHVLHGKFLYRIPSFAKLWKRIHYDHHQDPRDLRVLFGALYTTLPTIAIVTLPVGALLGGKAAAAAAFAGGLGATLFYEYCHCIQHLSYSPRSKFMKDIKRLHLLHHYYNENGNYGITNFFWDRMTGNYYSDPTQRTRSPTVFNLGYDGEESERYPWVANLSSKQSGH